jgi:hypothetical protein
MQHSMQENLTKPNTPHHLMSVCLCIVNDMKTENQLDATQWFIELMI